ncbi:copper-translocating P-type ATPase [Cyphellophora europaea CBS 101466]|uniref:Copper-translocating P-type ATPase n=1 Tax=Cyphellophora europaea (strain CBS 101466) TaxID=1220924 RepID=W2RQY5_CYPE1|nr:copper-translocating P-type ATPase [Cyphellophora europaea CBS 101466]ETN38740.1 copper-translocating P-type ATPase [Cyphellophora europaea CBS 101466]
MTPNSAAGGNCCDNNHSTCATASNTAHVEPPSASNCVSDCCKDDNYERELQPPAEEKGGCTDGCCGDEVSDDGSTCASELNEKDGCCEDGERCDEQCIKTAAAVECQIACKEELEKGEECGTETNTDAGTLTSDQFERHHPHAHEGGHHPDEACTSHLQAAFDKYAAYLEQARCICRSVLGGQLDQCCGSTKPLLPPESWKATSTATSSKARGSLKHRAQAKKMAKHGHHDHGHDHHDHHDHGHDHGPAVATGCCGDDEKIKDLTMVKSQELGGHTERDLERDGSAAHVLLNVVGMDCSGCANNVARALRNIPSARNIQVVFVTGIAELDVDLGMISVEAIVSQVEKATRYKIMPFSADTQTLDVTMDKATARSFEGNLPHGVESCEKNGKTKYAVTYDPCMIGARQVLRASGGELAPLEDDSKLATGKKIMIEKSCKAILALILSLPVISLEWGNPPVSQDVKRWVPFALATVVQVIAIPEFYTPAMSALWYNHVVEMDMLVVISITAAYLYSVVALGFDISGHELEVDAFFETSSLLIALVLIGRAVASWARKRAVDTVSMKSLQATTAMLGDGSQVDARLLHVGDVIKVMAHSKVVTDAIVTEGKSEVDESMLTGESLPVLKTVGSSIIAGTLNGTGSITAKVSRLPGKNTINDIENLVAQAQNAKPKIQDLADRIASWFVYVVVVVACLVVVIWAVVARQVRQESPGGAAGTALSHAIAVLAISCPCALGLAVPMVLVIAGGRAAHAGIIIKSSDVTERGHKVTDVVFDKTGTLTQGDLEVVEEVVLKPFDVSLVKAMVTNNQHPVSQAVALALEKRSTTEVVVENLKSVPGAGIEGVWQGRTVRVGNPTWLGVKQASEVVTASAKGLTLLCASVDGDLVGIYGLKSTLRPEASRVIEELQRRQITLHIVSGDGQKVVEEVANSLKIPLSCIAAEKTPAQKQDYVRTLMDQGKITLFCGDGTNDAIAVAQANVGVQIESSSDLTRATADVILLGNLEGVVQLLDVSKAAYRRIVFNFVWSAVYNVFAILLASGAAVRFTIPPQFAGLGEIVSVAPVIFAALTMPKIAKA